MADRDCPDLPKQTEFLELTIEPIRRPVIPDWEPFDLPDILPRSEQGFAILEAAEIELLRRIDKLVLAIQKVAPDESGSARDALRHHVLFNSLNLRILKTEQMKPDEVPRLLEILKQNIDEVATIRLQILQSLPPEHAGRALEAESRLNFSDEAELQRHSISGLLGFKPGYLSEAQELELLSELLAPQDRGVEEITTKLREDFEARVLPPRQGLRGLLKILPVEWLDSLVVLYELPFDGRRPEREKRLAAHLMDGDVLWQVVFEDLSDEALEMLTFLLEAGGSVPLSKCTKQFGDDSDARYLWGLSPPDSPLGYLRAFGLAFVGAEEHRNRSRRSVVVPRELREPLARVLQELAEEDGDQLLERVQQWIKNRWAELESTSAWKALDANARDDIRFVAEIFVELMLVHQYETPGLWTQEGLASCCLEDFPRQVTADAAFFKGLPQLLDSLLAGLGELGRLPQSNDLREELREIAPDISRAAHDHSAWGPAKTLAMAAEETGVDVDDADALHGFIDDFNRPFAEPEPPIMPVRTTKVGRNQPCPCGSGKKYKRCCGR